MSTANNNNDMLLIGVLVVGAMIYSRRAYAGPVNGQPTGTKQNSLPGNLGTGVGQAIGGALGGWLTSMVKGSSNNGGSNNSDGIGSSYSGSPTNWLNQINGNDELKDNFMEYGV
ncbi:hypothetical protein [Pseudoduganella sp. UC29_71]|uniref:hypothetical protein n=1 Tax=Pseudoduganella sp. UC29_71 TaxID=3350174 RepID=UPI00366E5549